MKKLKNSLVLAFLAAVPAMSAAQDSVSMGRKNFPVSFPIDYNHVEWKRGLYRELSLSDKENGGLYCPPEQTESGLGLFRVMFSLAVNGAVPVYAYAYQGKECMDESCEEDIRNVLTDQQIPFTERDGQISVCEEDVPASDIQYYYVREETVFDASCSVFRTRVTAICPVLVKKGETETGKGKYPMFWMKYGDLEPYLRWMPIITDCMRNEIPIPMTDWFTLGLYKGVVYKAADNFGRTLAEIYGTKERLAAVQDSIDGSLQEMKRRTYGTRHNVCRQGNEQ